MNRTVSGSRMWPFAFSALYFCHSSYSLFVICFMAVTSPKSIIRLFAFLQSKSLFPSLPEHQRHPSSEPCLSSMSQLQSDTRRFLIHGYIPLQCDSIGSEHGRKHYIKLRYQIGNRESPFSWRP